MNTKKWRYYKVVSTMNECREGASRKVRMCVIAVRCGEDKRMTSVDAFNKALRNFYPTDLATITLFRIC